MFAAIAPGVHFRKKGISVQSPSLVFPSSMRPVWDQPVSDCGPFGPAICTRHALLPFPPCLPILHPSYDPPRGLSSNAGNLRRRNQHLLGLHTASFQMNSELHQLAKMQHRARWVAGTLKHYEHDHGIRALRRMRKRCAPIQTATQAGRGLLIVRKAGLRTPEQATILIGVRCLTPCALRERLAVSLMLGRVCALCEGARRPGICPRTNRQAGESVRICALGEGQPK